MSDTDQNVEPEGQALPDNQTPPQDHIPPADQTPPGTAGPDLSAAARALSEAAGAFTRALGDSFHEVRPTIKPILATGLREAAQGLNQASAAVRASAARAASEQRAAKSEQTRARLFQAAGEVIAAQGYEGASMDDIAAAAGFTKGALYARFASKEDLFAALADQHLSAARPDPGPGRLADPIVDQLLKADGHATALLTLEILAHAARNPGFRDRIRPALDDAVGRLADQVAADRAASGGASGEPALRDLDSAIGLIALTSAGPLTEAALTASGAPNQATARLVERVLAR
ncbi:MAG: TetR/AcrR family transcriptional regulator [Bifidobacteriaceae bacterium]|jgi:AcrR family transcriptional regulator|nr:TetR/AcrR family transcriptional regulator [Bifidobacteriaceae bacterium]